MHELTITDIQTRMAAGELTAVALTESYLHRIAKLDRAGPALNSVIELNPDALEIAAALDAERRERGRRRRCTASPSCSKTTSTPPTG